MPKQKFDFGGYATKNDLKCSDGRTIRKDAFKNNDGRTVPLVWQHLHNDPGNVLGHAVLENRNDGVYAYAIFNDTDAGKNGKMLVQHKDITALSIHANQLEQKGNNVLHGEIREVSLVMAGANPGAFIDNLEIEHGDGSYESDITDALIYTDEVLSLTDVEHDAIKTDPTPNGDGTMKEIFDTLSPEQKTVVYAMISHALNNGDPTGTDPNKNINHSDEGGSIVKKNVFEGKQDEVKGTLTHAQFDTIIKDANKSGSLKEAILSHATEYGIENIDILFPDAQTLTSDPAWLQRNTGWVAGVLAAIHHSPFSRVKSVFADMDIETARAKGYIKGSEKKEVFFSASKRVTTPATVYVKQKLDRDDMIDVVDFDAVAMIRYQLRTLLDEELANAALIGDGRDAGDQYKISEENIRPIWTDVDLFSVKEALTTKTDFKAMIKAIAFSGENYKGSGSPIFYTTNAIHMGMLWVEDANLRRIYESDATLCAAMGVSAIVEIPAFVGKKRTSTDGKIHDLIGIKVNLKDYNFGADKGGQIATFDDFDIDFNQYKYLMETRCSGALTIAKSAQIYEFEEVAG